MKGCPVVSASKWERYSWFVPTAALKRSPHPLQHTDLLDRAARKPCVKLERGMNTQSIKARR
jgi:hypothetical protein